MPEVADTIAAVSTPPGRGAIGIVRLSGAEAVAIAERLVKLNAPLEHARARFGRVLDPENSARMIDEAVVTAFLAPQSYTGEALVEIAAHGSPAVLEAVLRGALRAGARLASAGEFTQRAFLAGKLDLTQAEAVHDLIAAQTLDQARVAAQQLGGALSRRVAPAKEALLHLIAVLEAGMDFASGELDDVEVVAREQIAAEIAEAETPLRALAESFRRGQLMREGISLALVGKPNAGKSSLFNRLLQRERAIVTAVAGTTRDTVEETVALGGIPVRLIDTAGLRDAEALDEAEMQGILRSREALADADLVLVIRDASLGGKAEDFVGGKPHLLVANKVDLAGSAGVFAGEIGASALTGEGIEELRAAILRAVQAEGSLAESGALNNLRQQEAVLAAISALHAASAANAAKLPHELILLDLHAALKNLDALTGLTTTDDILGRIFATFCIGK